MKKKYIIHNKLNKKFCLSFRLRIKTQMIFKKSCKKVDLLRDRKKLLYIESKHLKIEEIRSLYLELKRASKCIVKETDPANGANTQ